MNDKNKKPRQVDNFTANVKCDNCNCDMTNRKNIWIWAEHFGCTKPCVEKAFKDARPELLL